MFDDTGFFHMLDSERRPWLTWVFFQQGRSGAIQLWMVTGDLGLNYLIGNIKQPKLRVWYHVCVSIDTKNETSVVSVNGDQIGTKISLRKDFIRKMPRTLNGRIVLGSWVETWGRPELQQFDGSVGNVRLFSWDFQGQQLKLSKEPCGTQGDLLDWQEMKWEEVGEGVSSENMNWSVCYQHVSRLVWLVLPEAMSQEKALRTCDLLGHGHIVSVPTNKSLVFYEEMFDEYAPGLCKYAWTPFSDKGHENEFQSLEDNSPASFMPWADGQPNGAMVENSVILRLDKRAYFDVVPDFGGVCTACDIPTGLGFQLRGACRTTYLGKTNIRLLHSIL